MMIFLKYNSLTMPGQLALEPDLSGFFPNLTGLNGNTKPELRKIFQTCRVKKKPDRSEQPLAANPQTDGVE
ncbi:MAG: hypothetical protein K9H62_19755 [Bacteroidales bacterium]|nr:hypothetical protein [Bacteroidales bacterium]